jgi:hypothetical protein
MTRKGAHSSLGREGQLSQLVDDRRTGPRCRSASSWPSGPRWPRGSSARRVPRRSCGRCDGRPPRRRRPRPTASIVSPTPGGPMDRTSVASSEEAPAPRLVDHGPLDGGAGPRSRGPRVARVPVARRGARGWCAGEPSWPQPRWPAGAPAWRSVRVSRRRPLRARPGAPPRRPPGAASRGDRAAAG